MIRRRRARKHGSTGHRGSLLRAVTLVRSAGGGAFPAVIALFAISSLGLVVELLIGNALLHEIIRHGDRHGLSERAGWLLGAIVVLAGIVAFATAAGAGLHRLLAERTIRFCTEAVLVVAANVPLSEFDTPEFHDRIQRARANAMSPLQIAMAVPQLVGAVVGAVAVTAGLAVVSPWLVPIVLLSAIPLWVVGARNSDEMYSFSFGNTPSDRARQHIEALVLRRETAPEVRAFRLGGFLCSRWSGLYDERLAGIRALVRRFVRRAGAGAALGSAVIGIAFLLVLLLVRRGDLTLGAAATACVAVLMLANRAQQAASSLAQTTEHALYVEDFLTLRAWSRRLRPAPTVEVEPFRRLEVDAVSFSYAGASTAAVENVSLAIGAGEVIAVVGQNGSGKTTLAKLLAGLYQPTAGRIRWDDRDLASLTIDGGLSQVGVVFQDFGRYWFSAADNIGVGRIDRLADRAGIERAAVEAGASDLIGGLPSAFDTPLGVEVDGGVDLSGGQWQRIAIARVLFRDASFLILDEPTAALDAEAEAALFETIRGLAAGRSVVLISHRFSTVRSADRIVVMHAGHLVEQGDHDALMAAGGRYARMYSLQASAYAT